MYLLLLIASVLIGTEGWHTQQPSGRQCSPPPGYLPRSCRAIRQISQTVQRLPAREYGVNVCRVNRTHLVYVYNYNLQQSCRWEYYYYYYRWVCYQECLPSTCSYTTRVQSSFQDECCPGYIPRPPQRQSYEYQFYSQFFKPAVAQPSGCPLARAPTLYQCLEIHGSPSFLRLIQLANMTDYLNSTGNKITIFAPPDPLVASLMINTMELARLYISYHIIPMDRKAATLTHTSRLANLNGSILYVSTVNHYYYRPNAYRYHRSNQWFDPYSYNYYQHHQNQYILLGTDRFISGAQITVHDACKIKTGSLHLIDKNIPFTIYKLTELLDRSKNYSFFKRAMDMVKVTQYLDLSPSAHTIFAPLDSAFIHWSTELRFCLLYFDRRTLNDIVLYHISPTADYYSSLRLRNWIPTRLNVHIQVFLSMINRDALLTSQRVPILFPDNAATDGVLHGIQSVLIPPSIGFGECERFATPPPPSPTPSPSMEPVETSFILSLTSSSHIVPSLSLVPSPSLGLVPSPSLSLIPSPSLSLVPSRHVPSLSPSLSLVPSPSLSLVPSPSPSLIPSPSLVLSLIPSPSLSLIPSPSPSLSLVPSPSPSLIPSPSLVLSLIPSPSLSLVPSPSLSLVPKDTSVLGLTSSPIASAAAEGG